MGKYAAWRQPFGAVSTARPLRTKNQQTTPSSERRLL